MPFRAQFKVGDVLVDGGRGKSTGTRSSNRNRGDHCIALSRFPMAKW